MDDSVRIDEAGALSGKLLLFGGVYSNLPALTALRHIAKASGIPPGNIICTGDVVGYCSQPRECISLIKDWGIRCIAGNVELQLREGKDDCGCEFGEGGRCDLFSKNWYAFAKGQVGADELEWMETLPHFIRFRYAGKTCFVMHGSFGETAAYIFRSDEWVIKAANIAAVDADIVIAGHSGLPFVQVVDGKCWLNAGAIGMPANDGDTRVWYATMETGLDGSIIASLHQLAYNHAATAAGMRAAGLPEQYAETLLIGIWDNCEILPATETASQGLAIDAISVTISGRT